MFAGTVYKDDLNMAYSRRYGPAFEANEAVRLPDFTPDYVLEPPTDPLDMKAEREQNLTHLWGKPLSHRAQQHLAWNVYRHEVVGFNDVIVFTVHYRDGDADFYFKAGGANNPSGRFIEVPV